MSCHVIDRACVRLCIHVHVQVHVHVHVLVFRAFPPSLVLYLSPVFLCLSLSIFVRLSSLCFFFYVSHLCLSSASFPPSRRTTSPLCLFLSATPNPSLPLCRPLSLPFPFLVSTFYYGLLPLDFVSFLRLFQRIYCIRLRSPGSRRDDLKQGHGRNLTRQSSWICGLLLFHLLSPLKQWALL